MATEEKEESETKQLRAKYEDVVSIDIMDGLKEFCDEFSCIVVPPSDQDIELIKEKKMKNESSTSSSEESTDSSATLSMLESLNNLVCELSDNLNQSIVRIEELESAGNGLSNGIKICGKTVMDKLEFRIKEINETFKQINIINELIQIIEYEYVNIYKQRYVEVLALCDSNKMIQMKLQKDPIGTIKKQYIKTLKQNGPKIKNEINIQKKKFKKMKNNIQFSAKDIFSKLKQNQNIFKMKKDNNDDKEENHKQENVKQDNDKQSEEEEKEQQENIVIDIDEDQIKAIQEYKWNDLPILPEFDSLIDTAKNQYQDKKSKKMQEKKQQEINDRHEKKIKLLTNEDNNDGQEDNDIDNIINEDTNKTLNESEEDSVSTSHKQSLSMDLP